jgi:Tol biopolymer transport system component/imidazolonepropionase-like amidohydrolase
MMTGRWTLITMALLMCGSPTAAQEASPSDSTETKGATKDLPLEPGRTIPIDLDEGSWMSLDVSPDGRTIVFDYLGDLFTMPITGGQATQLTSGMAFDAQPRFSPDGTQVAFTSDRSGGQNIWVIATDGLDTIQVSRGAANRAEQPEWTPDGKYIVASMGMGNFRFGGSPTLRIFHIDGGGGAELMEQGPKRLGAVVSPDGRWVWYAERTGAGDWTYNAQLPQYTIRAYDRETGDSFGRVSRYGGAFSPTLSPDGNLLVYGTRHDEHTGLMIRDLDTGEERWLAYPIQSDDQESRATLGVLPNMSFTPDGQHVVASYGGGFWKIPVDGGDAEPIPFRVAFDLDVGPLVEFDYPIEDTPTFTVRQIRDAVPSPDGTRIAFTALGRLHVANADGTGIQELVNDGRSHSEPGWSPDGAWIAYGAWDGAAGEGHVYRVRSDGQGEPQQLTTLGGLYRLPAWAPDGDRIVVFRGYARDYEENTGPGAGFAISEVVWIPAGGGDATVIGPAQGKSYAHFRVDQPDRIYWSGPGGSAVSTRWDGTDEKTHVRVRGGRSPGAPQAANASVVVMAPTGDQAMALIQGQIYTVTVPMVGEAPTINVGNPASASFPAKAISGKLGAEFPAWSGDGRAIHWSLGNAHFVYDLDDAQAFADSLDAAKEAEAEAQRQEAEETPEGGEEAEPEAAEAGEEAEDAEEEPTEYEPVETRFVLEAPRDIPEGLIALTNARIITMDGDEVIERGTILVRNNRIEAVGAAIDIPSGAELVDLAGRTVVPGFVDTHAHLRPAFGVHRTDLWVYQANLAYGVTATRDPQTATTDVLTYADLVRAGETVGPRVYSTGPGVFFQENLSSLDETRDLMRRYSDYFDTKTLKMYVSGTRKQRQWIIQAARELEIMPTTEGSLNFKQNTTETLDGYPGLEHSIPVYPLYDDMVALYAGTMRAYTPTLLVSYGGPWAENWYYTKMNPHDDAKLRRFTPHQEIDVKTRRRGGGPSPGPAGWFRDEEHVFQDHAVFAKDLVEAGGRVGVGSHGQLQGLGYHWELWSVASGGMDNHDALRVATILGAEAIGLDQDLGSIEEGKLADLVILSENPLDDLMNTTAITHVMFNGRLYEGDTLQEIYPRQRDLPPVWWTRTEPSGVPGMMRQ